MATSLFKTVAADMLHPATRVVFGEDVTMTVWGGSPVALSAPFDAAYVRETFDENGMPVSAVGPVLGPVDSAYLTGLGLTPSAEPEEATVVVAEGTTYRVDDIQPDGVGSVLLILAE